jgi:hypothetical protein
LPAPLIRHQRGVTKDWIILIDEDRPTPLAWRVHARFAGYLIGRIATLIHDAQALATLEIRLASEEFSPEARTLFADVLRTARAQREKLRAGHVTGFRGGLQD